MTTFGNVGNGLRSRPRNGLICLSELAGLLAGGITQYDNCLKALCDEFPAGDERLVWGGDPQSDANITNIDAIKYWSIALPDCKVPDRLIEPAEIEDLVTLVEALRDENSRLRGVAEEITKQFTGEVEENPLTNCDKVTFGAVCFLLAKYGIVNRVSEGKNGESKGTVIGEKVFQTKGIEDIAPVPNYISSEIEVLAKDLTGLDDNYDKGFIDSGRRTSISKAMAAFLSQIDKNKKKKR
jgi:hypothetical protein